jgi:hypothetical protein
MSGTGLGLDLAGTFASIEGLLFWIVTRNGEYAG